MPFDTSQWEQAVVDLKTKAREFTGLYDRVKQSTPQTPELGQTRERIIVVGDRIKGTIEHTTQAIDAAYARYKDWFGNDSDANLQGLGILPLIPIATITGAVAAVTYGTNKFKEYLTENDRMERLAAEGYTTEQSIDILRSREPGIGPSIERGLKTLGPWIAVGVAVYFFTQKKLKF